MNIILLARSSSSRLPGKIFTKIGNLTVLEHVLYRISHISDTRIILATSSHSSDDLLSSHATTLGISVFRGSLNNVADRFYQCMNEYDMSHAVRLNCDRPFICSSTLQSISRQHLLGSSLLTSTVGSQYYFPPGQCLEVIDRSLFHNHIHKFSASDAEHVTQWFYHHPAIITPAIYNGPNPNFSHCSSMALDTPADLSLYNKIANKQQVCLSQISASLISSLILESSV